MKFIDNPELFKKKFIIGGIVLGIVIILVIIVNILGSTSSSKDHTNKGDKLVINEIFDNVTYCNNTFFKVEEKDNTKLYNKDLKLIEDIKSISNNVYCLYDYYYLVKSNDNYILKRKGSIIAKDIQFINIELFKTDFYQDKSAKFISYMYLYNIVNGKNTIMLNDYVSTGNLLYNAKTGEIIDSNITSAEIINDNFLYVKTSTKEYIIDTKNNKKILEDYKFKLTNSNKYLVIEKNNQYGVATFDGDILFYPEYEDIDFASNNENYIVVKKGQYYGLINKSVNLILPFESNIIKVYKDFYFTIKNNILTIYYKNNKIISELTYKVKNIESLNVVEYKDFYTLGSVIDHGIEKKLIIEKNGEIHLVDDITLVKYSNIFYEKEMFIVNLNKSFYLYKTKEEKVKLSEKIIANPNNAVMLTNKLVYIDFPVAILNKTRFVYFSVNKGNLIDYNTLDTVVKSFEVFKANKIIFSKEDNKISVYNDKFELLKSISDVEITHLYDDYYIYKEESVSKLVEIKY